LLARQPDRVRGGCGGGCGGGEEEEGLFLPRTNDATKSSLGGGGVVDSAGQREGMEMMKKKRVDYVLRVEQQQPGTHFS
jgi:hypothetical protein